MKPWAISLLFLLSAPLAAERQLELEGALLDLRAEARACYLGFVELYEIDYFARPGGARCVQVSYLREFSREQLDAATLKVFETRHGREAVDQYRTQLQRVGSAYRPVVAGDGYTYCVSPQSNGLLLRDGAAVVRFGSADFAERFLQIWVKSDRAEGDPEWGFSQC